MNSKISEKIEFDILNLHSQEDNKLTRSLIHVSGKNLASKITEIITEIIDKKGYSKSKFYLKLALTLGRHKSTIKKHILKLRRSSWVPLYYIRILLFFWSKELNKNNEEVFTKKKELQEEYDFLKMGQYNAHIFKCPKTLTEDLCKIVGASAADGHLNRKNGIVLEEADKSAVLAFSMWIKNVFGVEYKVFKSPYKSWRIETYSKVIVRYLTEFLNFPVGNKSSTIKTPKIIKDAPLKYRIAYAKGVMMFDGSVTLARYVILETRSETHIMEINEIVKKTDITTKLVSYKKDYTWRIVSLVSERWLKFFEEKTLKYDKLKLLLGDYNFGMLTNKEKCGILCQNFSENNASTTSFSKVIYAIEELNNFTYVELSRKLKIAKNTLCGYIFLLKLYGIIKIEKTKGKKQYFRLNP
jgi:hypothetical protein